MAGYLDSRHHDGVWLVRIENIDPPREMPGADARILSCLQQHGLHWDGLSYQSDSRADHMKARDKLVAVEQAYHCGCSRADLLRQGIRRCLGGCRNGSARARMAVRLRTDQCPTFADPLFGTQGAEPEDFVIWRKDDLPSYQLAVAVNDHLDGVTKVVRGCDLLDSTWQQILIMQHLGFAPPKYLHHPLVSTNDGHKLSKQNKAKEVDIRDPVENIRSCLRILGQRIPQGNDLALILIAAASSWSVNAIPRRQKILLPSHAENHARP